MISLVRGQQDTGASPSLGAFTGMVSGLMKVLGYDDQRLSSMAVNMALYVGELTANSLLDVDNNIDTEMSEYRSFSQSGDIFSLIKVHGMVYLDGMELWSLDVVQSTLLTQITIQLNFQYYYSSL